MKELVFNPTTIFHLLRHFQVADPKISEYLIGKNHWYYDYSKDMFLQSQIEVEDIEKAVTSKGSKFSENLSIEEIIDIIQRECTQRESNFEWQGSGPVWRTEWQIEYDKPVGKMSVKDLHDLSEEDIHRVKEVKRSDLSGDEYNTVKILSNYEGLVEDTHFIQIEMVSCG